MVVEKPFGHDLASAQELNGTLRTVFDEDAIYRIDHFLGEETVLNVLYVRMANSMVETLLDRRHVTRVQITMAEDFGVEDRGSFYDGVGCLLDVVENHVFQIVSLLTMDPPATHAPDPFRAKPRPACSSRSAHSTPPTWSVASTRAIARSRASDRIPMSRRSWPCGSSSTRPGGPACQF